MLTLRHSVLAAAVALLAVSSFSNNAQAGRWNRNHPRRTEVNHRLDRQDARIHQERASGQITGAQARTLHSEDHAVRTDERAMAANNGGHITKQEQHALNHQENGISKQIGQ